MHRNRRFAVSVIGVVLNLALVLGVDATAAFGATTRDCSDRVLAPGADLRRCDLRSLPVAGADLTGASLDRAILTGMNLDNGPDGPETTLADASLVRANLHGAFLSASDFRRADLTRADLGGVQLEDSRFADVVFAAADLRGASFFFTDAARGDFGRADLRGASATHSAFVDASFMRAELGDVDFTGSNLNGASFLGAAGLDSVTWANTICPDGSNSDDVGGSCIGHL